MKMNRCAMLLSTVALGAFGLSVQACGGAPQGEPTAQSEKTATAGQDLSIIGIQIPEPTVTVGVNDASVTINPIGVIDELLPPVTLPDPLKPVNNLIGALDNGLTVGVAAPAVSAQVTVKSPIELPKLPDPFDGGIPILVP